MKTGFSRKCITPPLGTPIAGYYEYRETKGVLDDLYASAVAFEDGGKRAVIIAADTLDYSVEDCTRFRRMIAGFCKIPTEAVFINCSHTHTGPMVGTDNSTLGHNVPEYDDYLALRLRDAAALAFEDLKESRFFAAEGKAENISFIRRYRMKDGSVQTNPGVNNPNTDHALGTPNDTVKLIKIEREGGDNVFIVNFGTHPDTIGGEYISADWPGFVRSTVEGALPDTKCVFLLAPQGDVNHIDTSPSPANPTRLHDTFDGCPRSYEHSRHMGRVIAGEVLKICGTAEEISANELAFSSKKITIPSNRDNARLEESRRIAELHDSGRDAEIPFEKMELTTVVAEAKRIIALENGPESFDFTLSAIKLGELVFAGIPGEAFVEIGRRICDGSPFKATVLCCLTNGGATYFPSSSAYDEGGYESRSSKLKKGGDDIVVNGMTELLESMK